MELLKDEQMILKIIVVSLLASMVALVFALINKDYASQLPSGNLLCYGESNDLLYKGSYQGLFNFMEKPDGLHLIFLDKYGKRKNLKCAAIKWDGDGFSKQNIDV